MVRSCVSWVRSLLYALIVLALLGCLLEIGLRVYDSATGQVTRHDLYDHGLICKSWFSHHTLKPSRVFSVRNPDTEERARVIINSWGLRGAEPAFPKPPGLVRVLCLGDETTLAAHLDEQETFCARLKQELEAALRVQVEVLNAGVPDYCPLLEYLQMRHQLLSLASDLVVVNFDMSDVSDDYTVRRHAVTNAAGLPLCCAHPGLELSRGVKSKSRGESAFLAPLWCRQQLNCLLAHQNVMESGRAIEAARSRYVWIEDQPPDWSIHIRQAFEPLHQLHDLLATIGTQLVVAACPAPWQVSATASNGPGVREGVGVAHDAHCQSRRPFEQIAEFCKSHSIEYCDVATAFHQTPQAERLYQVNAAAYSGEGHALHARELARVVAPRLAAMRAERGSPYAPMPGPQAQAQTPSRN